jgi:hypothetical protein
MAKQVKGCNTRIESLKKIHTHPILLTKVGQYHIGQKPKQPVVDTATGSLGAVIYNVKVLGSSIGYRMRLKVGDQAPDFELPAVTGERTHSVRLRDYLGKHNVVITFHPLDWTPT